MHEEPRPDRSEQTRSEQAIRRLADKFFGRPTAELRQDPEFQQLSKEEVSALGAEYVRRSAEAEVATEEFTALGAESHLEANPSEVFENGELTLARLRGVNTVDEAMRALRDIAVQDADGIPRLMDALVTLLAREATHFGSEGQETPMSAAYSAYEREVGARLR
jgi:hypothetical protein